MRRNRPNRTTAQAIVVAAGAAAALGVTAAPATASPAGDLVAMTSSLRAQHGLTGYRVCGDLSALAASWAAHMAATHTLAHNGALTSQVSGWTRVGENVGDGPTASSIESAFVASAPHYANLTSPSYQEVGIGTATSSDGQLWVDEVFRQPSGTGCGGGAAASAVVAPRTSSGGAVSRSTQRRALADATAAQAAAAQAAAAQAAAAQAQRAATAAQQVETLLVQGAPERDPVGAALAFAHAMQVTAGQP